MPASRQRKQAAKGQPITSTAVPNRLARKFVSSLDHGRCYKGLRKRLSFREGFCKIYFKWLAIDNCVFLAKQQNAWPGLTALLQFTLQFTLQLNGRDGSLVCARHILLPSRITSILS